MVEPPKRVYSKRAVGANEYNNVFLPSGTQLVIRPFLVPIEALSYIARVLSLTIRLFANTMSGHASKLGRLAAGLL